jgi:hypothetical protein
LRDATLRELISRAEHVSRVSGRRNWARVEGEHHSGALFGAGKAGEWDVAGCAHARALVAAPRDLRMFYASPDAASGAWAIGAARSADGLAWKKAGARASGGASCGALGVSSRSRLAAHRARVPARPGGRLGRGGRHGAARAPHWRQLVGHVRS